MFRSFLQQQTRRHFLRDCQVGIGAMALSSLLNENAHATSDASANPLASKRPPHAPKAKHVIFLHLSGSPPQHDLFDYKPKLQQLNGEPCPKELYENERFAFIKGVPKLLGTPHRFRQRGESGTWVSDVLPDLASIADDLAVVKSMYTSQFNHGPAQLLLYTGSARNGWASMGSWITYGLGSENQDLPGFVVFISGGTNPSAGKAAWGSGFLPSVYQGVQCRSQGDPILYVSNPAGMDRTLRRLTLDSLGELNRIQANALGSPETLTRIAQYELAYRMQISVPEVMDISREPKHVLEAYGAEPGASSFANNVLLARRLVEKGVRYVQLFDWGWDFHGTNKDREIKYALPKRARPMDRAYTALIKDLKARGMLEDTLVILSGEFGRTPLNEARNNSKYPGRDHHPHSFTTVLAGGGIKPGISYGQTDDFGYHAVENKVHVHDLQATIIHLLGFDHERLTFPFPAFQCATLHEVNLPAFPGQ